MPDQKQCDPQRLERYLQHALDATEEGVVEQHLENCTDCQAEIQRRAASETVWSDAVGLLSKSEDPYDATVDRESNGVASHQIQEVMKLLSATDDPAMLGRFGGYEISGVVGSGGMSVVLKGLDRSLNRYVALKVMAPRLALSSTARLRFQREAQAVASVTHDNVIEIYAVSEANGLPYLVMPYFKGQTLRQRLDQAGPLPSQEILRIGLQIASGLEAAHAQGIVHRDIKPSNILMCDGIERLVITDFGLARAIDDATVTRTGVIAGTPQYMSPEQARGQSVDQRSDLFSLGSLMYESCTGRAPFRAEASYGVLKRITDESATSIQEINANIPAWLCGIIGKLHEKEPDQRFQSASELKSLLEECLAHVQHPGSHALPDLSTILTPDLAPGRTRITRLTTAMLAAASVALFGAAFMMLRSDDAKRSSESPPGLAAASSLSQPLELPLAQSAKRSDAPSFEESKKPSLGAQPSGQSLEEDEFRYQFSVGQQHAYLLTISCELSSSNVELDGLVTIDPVECTDEQFRLRVISELRMTEIESTNEQPFDRYSINVDGNGWKRWNSTRTATVAISPQGDIYSRAERCSFPVNWVELSDFILPPLIVPSSSDVIVSDSGSMLVRSDGRELQWNREDGVMDSLIIDHTFQRRSGQVTTKMPTHVQVVRITEQERVAWQKQRAESEGRSQTFDGPLSGPNGWHWSKILKTTGLSCTG